MKLVKVIDYTNVDPFPKNYILILIVKEKPEPSSRFSRNLIRRRKIHPLFLGFRSIGVVFSLTTKDHIDVLCLSSVDSKITI